MLISQHSCGKMESPSDSKIFHGSILLRADCRPPLFSYSGCFKTGVKCLVSKMVTIIFFFPTVSSVSDPVCLRESEALCWNIILNCEPPEQLHGQNEPCLWNGGWGREAWCWE